jgi:hypothetical protein
MYRQFAHFAILRVSLMLVGFLQPLSAGASADFVCVGSGPGGLFVLTTAAGSDHLPLFRPLASPSLTIGDAEIDLSNASATPVGAWLVVRENATKRQIFAMRKTRLVPDFGPEIKHPFCNKQNWRESCWAAVITFATKDGRATIKRAVCGVG